MHFNLEEISPVQKKMRVEIPADQVDVEIDAYFKRVQQKATIQGFRPGKAPLSLVKRSYGASMAEEVKLRLYNQTLFKILSEQSIEPIDSTILESDAIEQGAPFTYTAVVEVIPEIHLEKYVGLVTQKEKFTANPERIDRELRLLQENYAHLVQVGEDAIVENGHVATVDYSFSVDGFPEESSSAVNAEVGVGSNRHIAGFEEQLVGMKRGETKEIRVTLPEGYRYSSVDGKEGIFRVTIRNIERKELPALDDAFAKQCGDYPSLQDLRADVAAMYEQRETTRIENELKDRLIKSLIEMNPLEVPGSMVTRQLNYMLDSWKKNQLLPAEMLQQSDSGFRSRFHDTAADIVKGGLLLKALAEKENLTVEEADLEMRYELIAASNSESLDNVRRYYESNPDAKKSLISEIKENKSVAFLIDHAAISEVPAAEINRA